MLICSYVLGSIGLYSCNDRKTHERFGETVKGLTIESLSKAIDLLGGVNRFFSSDDVVILKPNLQWWNQGAPNIASVNTVIEFIMNRPGGFNGEVVLAENTHRGSQPWKTTAWAKPFERNSDLPGIINYNQLSALLKKKFGKRFSVCHWIDISSGGKRVYSPLDGAGYVLCDGTGGVPLIECNNNLTGKEVRSTIMNYPIFLTDNGTTVDFKNGVWEKGAYTGRKVKFINLAALNHHSSYCGVTSAVKNYMGIGDLSGGPDPRSNGKLTDIYYNFHSFAFNKWEKGPAMGALGTAIGTFIKTIRKADLNITTAQLTGLSSRTEPPVALTRTVVLGTDPVALDYHTSKFIIYPNSKIAIHNPDFKTGPLHSYLKTCAQTAGLNIHSECVRIRLTDSLVEKTEALRSTPVIAEKFFGNRISDWLKYALLRSSLY
jgi:hypothetical protein